MVIQEIMTAAVETIGPEATAEQAWARMQARRIHHLVVMERGVVSGIVSARDLGDRRGATLRDRRRVGDLMTPHTVTATPETTVKRAANVMRGYGVGCLPVLRGTKLVGIVTVTDLLELIGKGGGRTAVNSRGADDRAPHRGRARRGSR